MIKITSSGDVMTLFSGEHHKLKITVPEYAKVKTIQAVSFLTETNVPFKVEPLKNLGGRRGKSIFFADLTMPKDVSFIFVDKHPCWKTNIFQAYKYVGLTDFCLALSY